LLEGIDMDGYTAEQGHGQLSAWLDWHRGKLVSSTDPLRPRSAGGVPRRRSACQRFGLHGLAGLRQIGWLRPALGRRRRQRCWRSACISPHQPVSVGIAARELQLAPLLPWLALKPDLGLPMAAMAGQRTSARRSQSRRLALDQTDGVQAVDRGVFADLGIDPVGKLPGVTGLHGELRGDAEAFSLELPDQAATLQFPQSFRQPFSLMPRWAARWRSGQDDGDWHIGVDALDFAGTGYAGARRVAR
jgi:uncharacterized protein YhdP